MNNEDLKEAVEFIAFQCSDVPDVMTVIPEDINICKLRHIKKVTAKILSKLCEPSLEEIIEDAVIKGIQVAQYGSWFGTYKGDIRPAGSDGCISYKQTYRGALIEAINLANWSATNE